MQVVKAFLQKHWDSQSPLLLGYSGGPDSKALLYSLKELGVAQLHVAHVDHGWRNRSAEEAALLQEEIRALGFHFHSFRLAPEVPKKEAEARLQRLQFFHSLFRQSSFQALLLAHHAGDLAETTLKRALEGAHLTHFFGMSPISQWREMPVWRPFLQVEKKTIYAFLAKRGLSFFSDSTNDDPLFLRSRMRSEILPTLSHSFGKEVSSNLSLLSQRSFELSEYLERKVASIPVWRGPWGLCAPLRGVERMESRFWIQKVLREETLTRARLETLLDWLMQGKPHGRLSERWIADRGIFFLLHAKTPQFAPLPLIKVGVQKIGDWELTVQESQELLPPPHWKQVWAGRFSLSVSAGSYALVPPPPGRKLRELWNREKVPAFLRIQVPVLYQHPQRPLEFLSGKSLLEKPPLLKLDFQALLTR